jgi:hypothetical protein
VLERDAVCVFSVFEFFPDLASQELGQGGDGASRENWEATKLLVVRDVKASLNAYFLSCVFFFFCDDHQNLSFFLLKLLL